MSWVKDLNVIYEALNAENTISEGDVITGAVLFNSTSEIKVKSICVKVKGEARVRWTSKKGKESVNHKAYHRYFKVKQHVIAQQSKATVLPTGSHRLNFTLQIPEGDFPSSFQGDYGNIVYTLEAKVLRSWLWPSRMKTQLNFVSKSYTLRGGMRCLQSCTVDQKAGIFSKGRVNMSATADKKCSPGETLTIVANINNASSKKVTPKFNLRQVTEYKAPSRALTVIKVIGSGAGNPITAGTEGSVMCQVQIPENALYSIHNCSIISVQYTIQVCLDIKFSFDPTVILPLEILPAKFLCQRVDGDFGPYPAAPPGGYRQFPSTSFFPCPSPHPVGSGACGYPPPVFQCPPPYSFPSHPEGPSAPYAAQQGNERPGLYVLE